MFSVTQPRLRRVQFTETDRALEVTGGKGMADRLGPLAVPFVPFARAPVEIGNLIGPLVREVRAKNIGKQMVVAIPPTVVIERHYEQVASIQSRQHGLAIILTGDGIAQRAAQPVQD